jgi:hypothetical protein
MNRVVVAAAAATAVVVVAASVPLAASVAAAAVPSSPHLPSPSAQNWPASEPATVKLISQSVAPRQGRLLFAANPSA